MCLESVGGPVLGLSLPRGGEGAGQAWASPSTLVRALPSPWKGCQLFLPRFYYLFLNNLYLFLERGEGREKGGRETSFGCLSCASWPGTKPATQACAPMGNRTHDLSLWGTMPSPRSHTGQGYQPGFRHSLFISVLPPFEGRTEAELSSLHPSSPAIQSGDKAFENWVWLCWGQARWALGLFCLLRLPTA